MTSVTRTFCCLSLLAAALILSPAGHAQGDRWQAWLKGRWTGTISGPFRSQEVSWRFQVNDKDRLEGFMSPANAGMPLLPMQDLIIDENSISFSIASQNGSYRGEIIDDEIRGTWAQGPDFPLVMRKKHFMFALDDGVHRSLVGTWHLAGETRGTKLEFRDAGDNRIEGFLHNAERQLYDIPMVDMFFDESGLAGFATDDDRAFAGNLVNGVLVGEFRAPRTRPRHRTFVKEGEEDRDYALTLSSREQETLLGRWVRKDRGRIYFTFENAEDGKLRGYLEVPGDNVTDPILEARLEANTIRLLTFSGRSFTGTVGNGEMSGQYRVNNRPSDFTFIKQDDQSK